MTSTILSRKQLNFAQISIVCLDILKQCLIDILHIHIKPTDLGKKIRLSSSLTAGKNKLSSEQNDLCCPSSPGVPDYSKFDVTLLYKLIRNLCSNLKPSKEWGKEPKTTDLTIADDIERIRLFRNKHYAHADSAEIPDSEFTDLWNEGKSLVHRLQVFTTANGCKTNYELKMTNISGRRIKYEEYTSYVDLFRAIYVEGPVELNCGETAHYKADIRIEESAFLSVSWEKVHGSARKQIDTSCEKYRGSTSRQLNIHSVCKEDEGGYRAFISRKIDHEIFSNTVFLHVQGEPPRLDNLVVTTEKEGIVIHYTYRVSEHSPTANAITWAKNKVQLDLTNAKYRGGGLKDDCFIITSPTEEDRGEYSCTVSNDVGSDLQCVVLGLPRPHLLSSTTTIHGSKTTINCRISSCPSPEEVQWQKSSNGTTFSSVDVKDPKYHGSNEDLCTPFLIIPKTTFDDCLYYRIIVRNKIGECKSDTFFLEVTGDRPNISNMACNLKDAHSVRLNCDVFLNEKSPKLQEVFWTKNKQKLDIPGSGGKLSGVTINDPSLIINKVNPHDAGEYQLTATNSVGESKSDVIVLGIPNAVLQKFEMKEDGSQYFAVIIKSTPVPFYVQWTMKENESDTFRPINTNLEEYKGSSNSFPNPVLVVKHNEKLESCIFQIEVRNLIGKIIQRIPGDKTIKSLKMDDKTVGNLNTFYNNRGFSVRFGKVFDELAEKFPDAKVNRLKDLIQNSFEIKDVKSLKEAKSARDCFRILQNESIFTPSDVIALQYLLRMTGCDELEKICIEYASAQNAMYFYEHQPGNGFKNVHFHVVANLRSYYTEYITKVRETVAAIVGCTVEEIIVNGYLYSNSFILVLSIKEIYLNKLLNLKRQDKDELGILYIDYFKVDGKPIYLERSEAGKEETKDKNTSYQKVLCSPKDVRTHPRKKFDFTDEGPGESKSGVKRRSIYSGKVRLPGNKKTRTSNAELEQEVSSVAVRMMPEINTKIETTVFQQLDTCMDKGKEETKDKNTRYQKVLYSPKDVRLQPRGKFHFTDKGVGESKSGVKRRSIYSGKVRLPGNKKTRTSNAEKSGGPQQPIEATTFDTTGIIGLEQVVSSVAVRMMPEMNRKTEATVSQRLDVSVDEEKEETEVKNIFLKVLCSTQDISMEHKLSTAAYMRLCYIVGSPAEVKILREVNEVFDILLGPESDMHACLSRDSFSETFRLTISDIQFKSVSADHKVISDPSQILLYHSTRDTVILMESKNAPPGFTRLKLVFPECDSRIKFFCVKENNCLYISSSHIRRMSFNCNEPYNPVCSSLSKHEPLALESEISEVPFIYGFTTNHWPSEVKPWIRRCQQKGWPLVSVTLQIMKSGFQIEPIGSSSEEDLEWRLSFSHAEQMLIFSFSHSQFLCYALLKIFLKEVINEQSSSPILCSYFMKTVLFWVIQNDRTLIWTPDNLLCCFWNCFKLLIHWVNTGCCPNFFIPQNNMFREKVTGYTQSILVGQLYDLYRTGIQCLLLSPTMKSFLDVVISNEILVFRPNKVRGIGNISDLDFQFLQEMRKKMSENFGDLKRLVMLINRVEILLKGTLTEYQAVIVQYMMACILHLTGTIIEQNVHNNRHSYRANRETCICFRWSAYFGCVSEILYLSMFYYRNCQYNRSLTSLQWARKRMSLPSVKYHGEVIKEILEDTKSRVSLSSKLTKTFLEDIVLLKNYTYLSELQLEQMANKESDGGSGVLFVPPQVMLHFLFLLNHHKLGYLRKSLQSMQDLQTVLMCDDRIPVKFRDISWEILGISQQICGDNHGALVSFQRSLGEMPFHNIQRATKQRIKISLYNML